MTRSRRRILPLVLSALVGCGPSVGEGNEYELAVVRSSTDVGGRVWIVNASTGTGHEVPVGIEDEGKWPLDCFGWSDEAGILVIHGFEGAWAYQPGGSTLRLPIASGLVTDTVLADGASLVVAERKSSALLPGSNPPPGQAELAIIDLQTNGRTNIGPGGAFSHISVSVGPTVLARRTTYGYVPPSNPDDPEDYGGYSEDSSWRVYDLQGEHEALLGLDGEPVLSPHLPRIAWSTAEEVTVTDLEGSVLHRSLG